MRIACNLYAKNSAKCVKFMRKKKCEMREIYAQKTVRNACNLYAKNSAKCVQFMCKKQCEMREIYVQKNSAKCVNLSANFAVFLANKFGTFRSVFCRKIVCQFSIFSSFFMMIFNDKVCRDGIAWEKL